MKNTFKILLLLVSICLLTACKNNKNDDKEESKEEIKEENYSNLSDEEFLIRIGEFVEKDLNNVKWIFKSDGEGTVISDKEYAMKWSLKKDKLVVTIDWIHKEKNEYDIVFDKNTTSFTLNNNMVFVKSAKRANSKSYKKNKELLGAWISKSDVGNYMWHFESEYLNVGYYNNGLYLTNKYYWGVNGDMIELYSITGKKIVYNYVLNDEILTMYQDNEIKYTFSKYDGEVKVIE